MIANSYREQQETDSVRALSAHKPAMLQDETRKKDVSFRAKSIEFNRIAMAYIRDRNPRKQHQSW